MSTVPPTPPDDPPVRDDDNRILWALGAVALLLAIVGLFAYNAEKDSEAAQQKAQQLIQKFEAEGLRVPVDEDIIVSTLGDDGGAVCENPANALGKALLHDQLANGASFVGRRPVIADHRVVKGEALILEVYCPEKLEQYQDAFDDLKTDDTIKD